jgi:hypothetical protein
MSSVTRDISKKFLPYIMIKKKYPDKLVAGSRKRLCLPITAES